nr:hypothetical protein [Halorubellus sp. JP-L1]
MTRADAVALKERLADAVVSDREFFRTAGRHREDGSYEVRRRGADSSGNAKVFQDFDALDRLYERLPDAFDADDVSRTGITGSRRHMLVRHFAEHPAFDCEIANRSPLRAEKTNAAQSANAPQSAAGESDATNGGPSEDATDDGSQPEEVVADD